MSEIVVRDDSSRIQVLGHTQIMDKKEVTEPPQNGKP